MFYKNWMSYIKDDAKVIEIAIPGSHNSATVGMNKFACCQDGTLYKQYEHGVRLFDIRIKADKKGRLFVAHGIMKGMPAEEMFKDLKKILDETNEFFIISLRTYMNQKIGPVKLSYNGNTAEANRLIRGYLSPEKYALTDFGDIRNLTMGDIRKSGKKFILINENAEYNFSVACPLSLPWSSEVYGYKTEKFVKYILTYVKENKCEGFHCLQTQQTPNPGTENGWLKWPDDLDEMVIPYFSQIISDIASDPELLKKVNGIIGDFMAKSYTKTNEILSLNLLKKSVKEELTEEFKSKIG